MDIVLHKLDQIRKELKEIKEEIKREFMDKPGDRGIWPYTSYIIRDLPLGGTPNESVAGGTYPPKGQSDDTEMPLNGYNGPWDYVNGDIFCNCTTVLYWHYCLRHGWCK